MLSSLPPLYHYSAPGGLLGVFQSQSIWLSNIHYQNDKDEYYHALDLIQKVVKEEYPGLFLSYSDLSRNKMHEVYTFSLTEEADLLSQWRGYCPNGGYSYRINPMKLDSILRPYLLRIEPVIYQLDKKVDFIKSTILEFTPEQFKRRDEPYNSNLSLANMFKKDYYSPSKAIKYLTRKILNYAALLKHESFQEEKEWRIFTFNEYDHITMGPDEIAPRYRGIKPKFREGLNTIIPYLEIPFVQDGKQAVFPPNTGLFDEVVVGPTAHPELSEFSLNALLKSSNPNVLIRKSETPYRNW